MKARASFVSNSSSSSFIIAANPSQTEIEVTIKLPINLIRYWGGEPSKDRLASWITAKASTVEELEEIAANDFWDTEDFPEYEKARAAISSGKVVYVGYPSNESDDFWQQLIFYEGLPNLKGAELILFEGP